MRLNIFSCDFTYDVKNVIIPTILLADFGTNQNYSGTSERCS